MEETTLEERVIELEYLAKAIQNIAWWIQSNGCPSEGQLYTMMEYLTDPNCSRYINDLDKSKLKDN